MTTGIMTKTIIAKYFKTQPVLKVWFFGSCSQGEQTNDSDVMFLEMWSDLEELLRGKVDLVSDGQYYHIYWNDAMSVYHKHRVIDNKDGDLSIEETKLIYLLLQEVKKLKKEIKALKGE